MKNDRETEKGKSRGVTNHKEEVELMTWWCGVTCDTLTVTPESRNETFRKSSAAKNKPAANSRRFKEPPSVSAL